MFIGKLGLGCEDEISNTTETSPDDEEKKKKWKIKKSYKNILIYNISYKRLIDAKPLHIRFHKTDGFIRVYNGIRYLVLFGSEKYDFI